MKVLAASGSDQEGGKTLLTPLKDELPRMKLVWGDSHDAGKFIAWLKEQLGWTMQPVRALTVPKRGFDPAPDWWRSKTLGVTTQVR